LVGTERHGGIEARCRHWRTKAPDRDVVKALLTSRTPSFRGDRDARIGHVSRGNRDARHPTTFAMESKALVLSPEVAALAREDAARAVLAPLARRDPDTLAHCVRVGNFAAAIAQSLDAAPNTVLAAAYGGLLHDAGKAFVPLSIIH